MFCQVVANIKNAAVFGTDGLWMVGAEMCTTFGALEIGDAGHWGSLAVFSSVGSGSWLSAGPQMRGRVDFSRAVRALRNQGRSRRRKYPGMVGFLARICCAHSRASALRCWEARKQA